MTLLNSFSLPAGGSPPSLCRDDVDTGCSSVIADESMLVAMIGFVSVFFSILQLEDASSAVLLLFHSARHFYGTPSRPKSASVSERSYFTQTQNRRRSD